jgi:uncharacterized caspase-like protein
MPAGRLTGNRKQIRKSYGFFVGIDLYQDKRIGELKGCVRDAKSLCEAFAPSEGMILPNEKATRKNILGEVQRFMKDLKQRDLLIFSVSAHGSILNNDFVIVTHDAEQDNLLGTVLSTYYTLNALGEITKNGGKVLMIIDTCHAGAISFDIARYSGILSEGGMSCLISSGPNEMSYEETYDTETGKVQQGVFTKHLIDGLNQNQGADVDQLGFITLRDLYDYVYQRVCSKFPQHPVLIGTLDGNTILKTF